MGVCFSFPLHLFETKILYQNASFVEPPLNQSYNSGNQYFSNATKWVSLLAVLIRRIKNQSNNIQIKKWES